MATITSLKFDISSKWDGGAVRQAQGDIKLLNQDLRTLNNTRIRVRVELDDAAARAGMDQLEAQARDRTMTIEADVDAAAAEARIAELARDRRMTVEVDYDTSVFDRIVAGFQRSSVASNNFGGSVQHTGRMAKIAMAVFAASLMALPGIINLVSASLMTGLAGSIVAVGIIAQHNNEQILAGWEHLKNDGIQIFKEASSVMVDDFVGALDMIHDRLWEVRPLINEAFANGQHLIRPMTQALLDLATNAMPGANDALRNAGPVIEGLRVGFSNFGTSVSNMFRHLSTEAEAFGMMLNVTFTHIGIMMDNFGLASAQMAETGTRLWGGLLTAFNSLIKGMLDGFVSFTANAGEPFARFLEVFGAQLGDVFRRVMPLLGDIVRVMSENLIPIFERLTPVVLRFIEEGINGLMPAIETLMPLVVAVADGFATILEWLTPAAPIIMGVSIALWAVNAALSANPVMVVVIGITALVSGIVYLATKTQFFQTVWNTVWGGVKDVASAVWQFLQMRWDQFIGHITGAWDAVKGAFGAVWDFLKMRWEQFTGSLKTAWDTVSGALSSAWSTVWGTIRGIAEGVWGGLKSAWEAFVNVLQAIWDRVAGAFRAVFEAWWFSIRMIVAIIVTAIRLMWEGFVAALKAIWENVSAPLKAGWDLLWTGLKAVVEPIWNFLQTQWDNIVRGIQITWEIISGALSSAWNAVWTSIRDFVSGIWQWIQDRWNAIVNGIKAIWDSVSSALSSAWNAAWSFIRDVAMAIWQVLQDRWDQFLRLVRQIWDNIWLGLKIAWETAWNFVRDFALGIWEGIKQRWNEFTGFIKEVLQTTIDWITDRWNTIWNWVSQKVSDIWEGLKTKFNEIKDGIVGTFEDIVDLAGKAWEKIVSAFEAPVRKVKEIWNSIAGKLNLPTFDLAEGGPVGEPPPARRAMGGPVWGAGTSTSDSIPARLSNGEHVWTAAEVDAAGGHKAVEGLRQEALAGKFASGGAVEWMWARVQEMNQGMQLTSSYRNTADYHGQGKAIDVSNGSDSTPQMRTVATNIANTWGRDTLELIHSPFGMNIKNGSSVGDGFGFYGAATMNQHRNHVHWAVPGPLDNRSGAPVGGGQFVDPKLLKDIDDTIAAINKKRDEVLMEHRERLRFINQVQASRASRGEDLFRGIGAEIPWHGFDPNSAKMIQDLEAKKAALMAAAQGADMGPVTANAMEHAREIANAAKERSLGRRGAKIGIATGLVESNLRILANPNVPESLNYPHEGLGQDHDSIGIFQQRSQGWGTVAQRMNARASAGMFFNALMGFDWQSMEDGAAAQRVQRSAYPDRYSQRMGQAEGIVNQVYAKGTGSAARGYAFVGENGPEIVRFQGGEQVHSFDEIIAAVKDSAVGNTNAIIDNFTREINAAIDRIGGMHEQALMNLTEALSAEVKSFVAQAINGQQVSVQELVAKLELQLRNFIEGALQRQGVSAEMNVTLPNGSSATPQQIADALRSQVLPELERLILQKVGTVN